MTDEPSSMFDYDARPVTPQVVLVGNRATTLGYELRDFLSRNGVPYDWVEVDDADRVRQLFDGDIDPSRLPICVLPDGRRLRGSASGRDRSGRPRRAGRYNVDDRELSRLSARRQRKRAGHPCHRAG